MCGHGNNAIIMNTLVQPIARTSTLIPIWSNFTWNRRCRWRGWWRGRTSAGGQAGCAAARSRRRPVGSSTSTWVKVLYYRQIITVHKRSLRRLCFYTCLSVYRGCLPQFFAWNSTGIWEAHHHSSGQTPPLWEGRPPKGRHALLLVHIVHAGIIV